MDSLIAENYLFDATLDNSIQDGDRHLILQKNMTPYIDQNRGNGSYTNGKIIIDSQTGNGSDYNDDYNSYITLPYVIECTDNVGINTVSAPSATLDPSLLIALKNESLIDSIRVEQGGRTIISESQNLSHLINFVKHCTSTTDSIKTDTRFNKYSPDGMDMNASSITANIGGVKNIIQTSSNSMDIHVNKGLVDRQMSLLPQKDIAFSTQAQKASEYIPIQDALTFPTGSGELVLSRIHLVAVIYLRDLADFFHKTPLSKGGYKITIGVNQATTTFSIGSTATPFEDVPTNVVSSITSGSVNPMLACIGPNTANAAATWGAASTHILNFKAGIDTSSTLQTGVILYVPSYTMAPEYEQKLLNRSVVHRTPYMVNSAMYTSNIKNAPINIQMFSAVRNPRTLILIPQFSQSEQTQPSQASIFNTSPATTDPYLSLTRLQIRLGNKQVLASPVNYGYQQFIENTSRMFKLNGGMSTLTSGVIDMAKFSKNFRYYVFDLDILSADQEDIPQIISLESFNNSNVAIDLYCFVLFKQDASFDLLKGTVEIQ